MILTLKYKQLYFVYAMRKESIQKKYSHFGWDIKSNQSMVFFGCCYIKLISMQRNLKNYIEPIYQKHKLTNNTHHPYIPVKAS